MNTRNLESSTLHAGTSAPARPDYMLLLLRAAWIVLTSATVLLSILGIPTTYTYLRNACEANCADEQITLETLRDLHALGISPDALATYRLTIIVAFMAVYFTIATLIFVRRPDDKAATFSAITLVTFGGAAFTGTMSTLPGTNPVWGFPVQVIGFVGQVAFLIFAYTFPDGRFIPRWSRWVALAWFVFQLGDTFFPGSLLALTRGTTSFVGPLIWLVFILSTVVVQIYRYRKVYTPVQQQQTKWVVFGFSIGVGGFLGTVLSLSLLPYDVDKGLASQAVGGTLTYLFMLILPVSIGLAMLRSRLYDVDILINRTLVYTLLSALLGLGYFGGVVLFQGLFRPFTGQGNDLAIATTTLIVAALFLPLRARIQALIDRQFYRRKYDAARALAAFGAGVRDDVDLRRLTDRLVDVVNDTMQPAHVSLWLLPALSERAGEER